MRKCLLPALPSASQALEMGQPWWLWAAGAKLQSLVVGELTQETGPRRWELKAS